jgi:hypothetical protein
MNGNFYDDPYRLFFVPSLYPQRSFPSYIHMVRVRPAFSNLELGMTTVEIAGRLAICQSAVSRSSLRGEKMAEKTNSGNSSGTGIN